MSVIGAGMMMPVTAQDAMSDGIVAEQSAEKQSVAPVYPIPQRMKMTGGMLDADGFVVVDKCPDEATLAALKEALPVFSASEVPKMRARGISMKIGGASSLPEKEGAYQLKVDKTGIYMVANDDVGLFYAAQTLIQLVKKTPEGVSVPRVEITDWPDIPFRGSIEGFYGLPWGQKGRISQFKFYGKYKLNTYIYGPKDDVYHGFSNRWRET